MARALSPAVLAMVAVFAVLALAGGVRAGCSQAWYGTAIFCDGKCPWGWTQVRRDNCGDGSCCLTGSKALCQRCAADTPNENACIPKYKTCKCMGIFKVCLHLDAKRNLCQPPIPFLEGVCFGLPWLKSDVGVASAVAGSQEEATREDVLAFAGRDYLAKGSGWNVEETYQAASPASAAQFLKLTQLPEVDVSKVVKTRLALKGPAPEAAP